MRENLKTQAQHVLDVLDILSRDKQLSKDALNELDAFVSLLGADGSKSADLNRYLLKWKVAVPLFYSGGLTKVLERTNALFFIVPAEVEQSLVAKLDKALSRFMTVMSQDTLLVSVYSQSQLEEARSESPGNLFCRISRHLLSIEDCISLAEPLRALKTDASSGQVARVVAGVRQSADSVLKKRDLERVMSKYSNTGSSSFQLFSPYDGASTSDPSLEPPKNGRWNG